MHATVADWRWVRKLLRTPVGGVGSAEEMRVPEPWVTEILHFWFIEIAREAWYRKDAAFDRRLRERFLPLHEQITAQPICACLRDAHAAAAAVIALDQFPRNMFRDTPRAFATDAQARAVAEAAIARGYAALLPKDQRVFLYLPFEHAEDAQAQARSVALMATLGDEELVRWALAHKAIIDRFGRFPHRNAILGRPSTVEEVAFLAGPDSAF
jgi:uncharacterized protein (DUF924 family)